jgi:hypothetical protein
MLKKNYAYLLLFSCSLVAGQNNDIPVLRGCVDHENVLACSYFTLQGLINDKINTIALEKIDNKTSEITISSLLKFDEFGTIDIPNSLLYTRSFSAIDIFEQALVTIPKINPRLSSKDNEPVATYYGNTFYFKLEDKKFVPWNNPEPKKSDYYIPRKVPVFDGCKPKWSNEKLKNCMSTLIAQYIKTSFNTNEAKTKSGVLPGTKVKIGVHFKVDKTGKIVELGARSTSSFLANEAVKVIKRIGNIKPGYIGHKPVITPYSLPIIFEVTY